MSICLLANCVTIKGTVSQHTQNLPEVLLDRVQVGEEPLLVFKMISLLSYFYQNFKFFGVLQKGCHFVCSWAILLKYF